MERTQSSQEQDPVPCSPRRGSIPLLGAISPLSISSATPSPKTAKRWSLFNLDPFATGSASRPQPDSPRSTGSQARSTEHSSADGVPDLTRSSSGEKSGASKIANKKRTKNKKVKTWAGSILSRKGKYRYGKQKRRAPTPPPPRPSALVDGEPLDMHPEPELEPPVPTLTVTQSAGIDDLETWTFPKPVSVPDDDSSYPMIDLDAALGPFNTPLPRNPEWEAAQRAGGHVKRQLHSAAGMSRFSGPGMHYFHRRAESAPELVPFEGGRFGFRRFGSSSTMADVFEEDEEEEEEPPTKSSAQAASVTGATSSDKPNAAEQPGEESDVSAAGQGRVELKAWEAEKPSSNARSTQDQPSKIGCGEAHASEVAPGYPPRTPVSSSWDVAPDSATPSPRQVFRTGDFTPVEASPLKHATAPLGPVSPWSTTQSSAFPSPRSAMSYDAHCISTAPSSVTEDNFQSLLMGEPGPEVRISVDDIPSLTSSNSTMTRDSLFAHHPQARNPPLRDQPRPASFTSTAFGRRRSSLVSLSRLINSSHGERSKLSIEVSMDSEPEKKTKPSKTRRLSRMVQFWKSKESNST